MFLKDRGCQPGDEEEGEGAAHLQLLVVRPAAAVRLLGRLLVGVEQEADAAVEAHLHVLHT